MVFTIDIIIKIERIISNFFLIFQFECKHKNMSMHGINWMEKLIFGANVIHYLDWDIFQHLLYNQYTRHVLLDFYLIFSVSIIEPKITKEPKAEHKTINDESSSNYN